MSACAFVCNTVQQLVAPGRPPHHTTCLTHVLACCHPGHCVVQERADLLSNNRKEVATLLEARATAESTFTDKLAAVGTYAHNLEHLRHTDGEEYQVLKIK